MARAVEGVTDPGSRLSGAVRAVAEELYDHQDAILLMFQESHALDRRSLKNIAARLCGPPCSAAPTSWGGQDRAVRSRTSRSRRIAPSFSKVKPAYCPGLTPVYPTLWTRVD